MRPRRDPGRRAPLRLARDRKRRDRRGDRGAGPSPGGLLAWLGPAIGVGFYEVDAPVRDAFIGPARTSPSAFSPSRPGHWHLDLYRAARLSLGTLGVRAVYGGGYCTYGEPDRFFSHRRDGATGRMATLIWVRR